jgi:hypothetical protein
LTHAAYEAIGQVEGALAHYADEVYAGLNQAEQTQARSLFTQLVRPGEGTEDTRRLAGRVEVGEANWALAQRLASARLVITGQDAGGQETVEVVHEALIRGWAQLREWMNADRAFRTWQERLRTALRQWQATEDEGTLLRGAPLAEAESWLAERAVALSQAELAFIQASTALRERRAAEREQERLAREELRRRVTLTLAVGLILAVTLAVLAGWQWQRAEEQRQTALDAQATAMAERDQAQKAVSRQLATQATTHMDNELDLALLLSLEAEQRADTREARSSLLTELRANPYLLTFLHSHTDSVKSVAFSSDGHTLASGSADGTLILWDVSTRQPLGSLTGHTRGVTSTL